jgi:hypothetical protein
MDRKEAWIERPKHGQKRSMDRKSGKHDRNMDITEARTEKVKRPDPKYGQKRRKKVRNTTETRTENVANTTEIWTENLTTTICCERNWVVSFLLKEQNKQTNKTQKDKQRECLNAFFSLLLAMSPTPAFLLLLLRPSLAGGGFNSRAFAGVHAYSTIAFPTAVKQI